MNEERLEPWQVAFRLAAPEIGRAGLEALARGLREDDPAICQGRTTTAEPYGEAFAPETACPIGFAAWKGRGLSTIREVQDAFHAVMSRVAKEAGEPGAGRWLTQWVDATPRDEMRAALLEEIALATVAAPQEGGVR
jgi:hypothetical protein